MKPHFTRITCLAVLLWTTGCDLPTSSVAIHPGIRQPDHTSIAPAPTQYPLHLYSAPSDGWQYITAAGIHVEMPADDQIPGEYFDGRRSCPFGLVGRNAHLRMTFGLETLDFDFRGPFTFLRNVSTLGVPDGGTPWPTALYTFHSNAYTRDDRYYAPAGGNVLLACDGSYVLNVFGNRLWVGHLYGKLYNGPIVRNSRYEDPDCGSGGGGPWNPWDDPVYISGSDPTPAAVERDQISDCDGGTGGGGAGDNGYTCTWDYVTFEISYDGGRTWHHFWSGWVPVCDENMA